MFDSLNMLDVGAVIAAVVVCVSYCKLLTLASDAGIGHYNEG